MRPRAFLLVALGLAAASGCNAVLGLDNFQVTPGTGGAQAGNAGAGGGTAATGGSGGTAATGGSGGTPVCGDALNMNQKVIQTCVLRASCSPFIPDTRISDCVTLNLQQAFIGTACTSNATNCSEVDLCQGYGFTTQAQCSGQTGWRCQNNVAINCAQGYYISCSKLGGQCEMYDSTGDFVKDTADCKVVGSCTSGQSGCQGDLAYTCVNGVGYGMACSNFGAQCSTQSGQPTCLLATQTCSGALPPCENGSAQACINGLKQTFDCSSVGLGCQSDAKNGPFCVAPGCTLAAATTCAESCTGSTAHLCYGGVPFDVDCKKYGFSTCTGHDDKAPPQGIGHYVVCSN
jgi:hypothetical protein